MPFFGQEIFEAAQATSGDLTDPAYRQQRATATTGARRAIDATWPAHRLDAILAPTNNAAWVTNLETGDDFTGFVGSSTPAAVSGYPNITVPAGFARGALPLGVSFFGGRFSEPDADRPRLRVRAGHPGAPPADVPADPAVVHDHGCSRRRPRTARPLVALRTRAERHPQDASPAWANPRLQPAIVDAVSWVSSEPR